jgi:carboxylesterase type B
VLSSPQSYASASASCQALNEQLWQPNGNTSLIQPNLDYLKYEGQITASSKFWIAAKQGCSSPRTIDGNGKVSGGDPNTKLPVLCTQTAGFSSPTAANTSAPWQISVASNNETYIGFRDRLSFRFLGIRYAAEPERFTYTSLYTGSGQTVDALQFGSICAQGGQGTEDCFFLNVWTDYLPGPAAKKSTLKPVMFWVHGGAFTGGEGSDPTADGANLAARGDVVVVTINYRLGSLGFLALNDGKTNGNFGFADQITALDWVRKNIADFGGDPDRITIFGQSAGAGSVRAMLASPKALGKFAGAIMLSNLGGIGYGTTYSLYYTIAQEVNVAANSVLASTGCTGAASQVDCLRNVSYMTLSNLQAARYLVVDGTYLTTDQLQLNGSAAPYKLMMGTMRDDGAPFIGFPTTTNVTIALQQDGFPNVPSTLFVEPTGANQTLDTYNVTAQVATDGYGCNLVSQTVIRSLQGHRKS